MFRGTYRLHLHGIKINSRWKRELAFILSFGYHSSRLSLFAQKKAAGFVYAVYEDVFI
jgi:hypothetical protein